HDRDNSPTHALVALRTPGDARTWGTTHDPRRLAAMTVDEHIGMAAEMVETGVVGHLEAAVGETG
ncbi:MAG: hypothetical protein QGI41_09485, partial [Acidimicrobiales bacterium]|nr:hypothetical protein [Acidimicrobiales bacterium]